MPRAEERIRYEIPSLRGGAIRHIITNRHGVEEHVIPETDEVLQMGERYAFVNFDVHDGVTEPPLTQGNLSAMQADLASATAATVSTMNAISAQLNQTQATLQANTQAVVGIAQVFQSLGIAISNNNGTAAPYNSVASESTLTIPEDRGSLTSSRGGSHQAGGDHEQASDTSSHRAAQE